ncbi:MAG: iron ABC transporter permease [Spirochaetaceae bacterium]|jgi:iron complex transport system permease protein|nr:iron ABC transporter permease [Spirochaetaceae bacterium]
MNRVRGFALFIFIFLAALFAAFSVGRFPLTFSELFTPGSTLRQVLLQIRLPRVLAAALVGAGLSTAGTAYQYLFNNPLVSPDILGASAGASFGAALSIIVGAPYAMVSFSAFCFGLLAVFAAVVVSFFAKIKATLVLVLAGIITASLFQASTSYLKLIADQTNVLPAITYWLMGSLAGVRLGDLAFASLPVCTGLIVLFRFSLELNIVGMGEDDARALGVNLTVTRVVVIAASTLITAACVSISGMIGWVGLIIPHIVRMCVGCDNRVALPASMLLGAAFLVAVDTAARNLSSSEIPIGILTAFIGAPFFVYVMLRRHSKRFSAC